MPPPGNSWAGTEAQMLMSTDWRYAPIVLNYEGEWRIVHGSAIARPMEQVAEYLDSSGPYPTKEAAMAACMVIYG